MTYRDAAEQIDPEGLDEKLVRQAVALSRELGILRFRFGDLELWLGPEPSQPSGDVPHIDPMKAEAERLARNRKRLFDSSGYELPPPENT